VVVITPDGKISRYLTGIDYAARDVRLGLVEASQGRIGSPSDQVLLLCYRYDPLTGRYGLAVSRAIQFAGIATFLGLIGGIGFLLRQEGHKNAT
jgi:protein SCO1/2